jgi:hypothetical protein
MVDRSKKGKNSYKIVSMLTERKCHAMRIALYGVRFLE